MRPIRFVAAHEWNVKESVGADVLGGPQPQSNANRVVGRLRAAEDVRPYHRYTFRHFGEVKCKG